VDGVIATIGGYGLTVARNVPYAGGYTLDRHGSPRHGINAIQIEFDRSLYLDGNLDDISAGLIDCRRLLADIADRLASMVGRQAGFPLAAE
jgi:N-formylglutamate amidohydrolase